MASDDPKDLKKRIDAMNRGPLPPTKDRRADVEGIRRKLRRMAERAEERRKTEAETPPPPAPESPPPDAIVYRRDLPQRSKPPARTRALHREVALKDAVQGEEITAPNGETAFLIEHRVDDLDHDAGPVCASFHAALTGEGSPLHAHLAGLKDAPPALQAERLLFFDLETTGLSSTPLFLIGAMTWENAGLVVRQYLARTYAEERAVIALFLDLMRTRPDLVSFNGKSYDLPYVRARAAATGLPFAMPPAHLDLVHVARRIWKQRLPDCRLQTLEAFICGRVRRGDIPGADIPDAYHAYVRTGNAAEIVTILKHNMLDLVTMADLMSRFPAKEGKGH